MRPYERHLIIKFDKVEPFSRKSILMGAFISLKTVNTSSLTSGNFL